MDFWTRLLGSTISPKKPARQPAANDPQTRLARFKRVFHSLLELCNRRRNLNDEGQVLDQLYVYIERISILLREESRAPVPHICFQFAASKQVYADVARAAIVSQYEPVIRSSIAVFSALIDSEEEDLLSSEHFAKSLMRLVRKVADSATALIDTDTETAILELLFTIAAKIRLQPEILPVWFQSTAKPELDDVFVKEKKSSFVGITQKDDFPLCYLLIDRVHHEGRIGDFARTGLLYVFEATGRSVDLEEWVVSSDLPTLMASGLGALYSQLSRELSIVYADAELPAVLAMSDYATTHARATAESAFSERHKSHMNTFLSYLAFWQDVLDHCRSADVKQTLLDHFQILFLQQLLYPSLLQSSDTDAGSSVAVLTYITAMLESLDYPDLIHMMLNYLLAIEEQNTTVPSTSPTRLEAPPPSPTAVKRRQSLMLLNAPKDPNDAVEPALFNLADLVTTNVTSRNSQSVFAALKLASTLTTRQKAYAVGNLFKIEKSSPNNPTRTVGTMEKDLAAYFEVATSLHQNYSYEAAYAHLCEDMRCIMEAQVSALANPLQDKNAEDLAGGCLLSNGDPLMRTLTALLRTFFTNSVDVNLALTQALVAIFHCIEIRLESWVASSPPSQESQEAPALRPWQLYLDPEERDAWIAVSKVSDQPTWSEGSEPILYKELKHLSTKLEVVRRQVPNMDQLIAGRKNLLQAANHDDIEPVQPASIQSKSKPAQISLGVPQPRAHNRTASRSSAARGRAAETHAPNPSAPPSAAAASSPASPADSRTASKSRDPSVNKPLPAVPGESMFRPPPPETPSTTDVLMQIIAFPDPESQSPTDKAEDTTAETVENADRKRPRERMASLNHILTNVVILQEFVLELAAVLQVRAAVLGEKEVRLVHLAP